MEPSLRCETREGRIGQVDRPREAFWKAKGLWIGIGRSAGWKCPRPLVTMLDAQALFRVRKASNVGVKRLRLERFCASMRLDRIIY